MISRASCLLALALLAPPTLRAQLTVRARVPSYTPPNASVYIAGSFNRWNPGDPAYMLARDTGGVWAITLPDSVRGTIEFKLTRGSWEAVETAAAGGDVANRSYAVRGAGPETLEVVVAGWRRPSSVPRDPPKHTASRSVRVMSDSFALPQLGRARRVWVYLPPDYARATRKRYPVIYMHDGQNVFDAATSFAGEWGVDEALDSLAARGDPGAIVVAVDNGGTHRLDEYNPWKAVDAKYGGGEGAAYVDFLVHTLKPYVDAHYRTRRDAAHTGIVGSSMGGLISLYAALAHPEVFGRAGVFSCACWISRPDVMALVRAAKPSSSSAAPRLYFVVGGEETADDEPVHDQQAIVDSLRVAGVPAAAIEARVVEDGKHAEWFWRREFPAAYRWLFSAPARSPRATPPRSGGG